VRFYGSVAVGAENVYGRHSLGLDIFDELGDWTSKDGALGGGEDREVGFGEGGDFGSSLALFACAGWLVSTDGREVWRNLPGSPVIEDVEGVQHDYDDWVVRLGMNAVDVGMAGGGQVVRNWASKSRNVELAGAMFPLFWASGRELIAFHILRGSYIS